MLKDLVLKNRSYRGYDESCKVSRAQLLDMVDHARLAPSSVNMQPLAYVVAYEEAMVSKIQSLTRWAKALNMELPHEGMYPTAFIVICQDTTIATNTDAYLRDVGIVAQTILLRAVEMGLGGCMIGSFNKQAIIPVLNLEQNYVPHLVIAIGKPNEVIQLTEVKKDHCSTYYRDENDVHYVPKRSLEDLIINKQ